LAHKRAFSLSSYINQTLVIDRRRNFASHNSHFKSTAGHRRLLWPPVEKAFNHMMLKQLDPMGKQITSDMVGETIQGQKVAISHCLNISALFTQKLRLI
jgi:hypothetical protein